MKKPNTTNLEVFACFLGLTALVGCGSPDDPPNPKSACPSFDQISDPCFEDGLVCNYALDIYGDEISCACEDGAFECLSTDDSPVPPDDQPACASHELSTEGFQAGQGHFQCSFDVLGAYDIDVLLSARPLGDVVDGGATDYEVQAQVLLPRELVLTDGMFVDDLELAIGNEQHAVSASVAGPCSLDTTETDANGSVIPVVTPIELGAWTAQAGGTVLSAEELSFAISVPTEGIDLQADCVWSVLPSVTFEEQKPDYCDPDPCDNGACEPSNDGYRCVCDDGFEGLHCTDPIPPAPKDTVTFSLTSSSTVNLVVRVPGGKTANMREETSELESCETTLYWSNGTGLVSCSEPATGTYETELYNPSPDPQRVFLQVNTRRADGSDAYQHGQWVDVPGNGSRRSFTWLRGSGSGDLYSAITWKSQDWQRESNDLDLVLRRCDERYTNGCEPGRTLGEATAARPSGIAGCSFVQNGNVSYTPRLDRRGNPDVLYSAREGFQCGMTAPAGFYQLSVESRSPTAAELKVLGYADDRDERDLMYNDLIYGHGSRSFGIYVLDPAR